MTKARGGLPGLPKAPAQKLTLGRSVDSYLEGYSGRRLFELIERAWG